MLLLFGLLMPVILINLMVIIYKALATSICTQFDLPGQFKQLELPEPWLVMTHTIWTTQKDVFIADS